MLNRTQLLAAAAVAVALSAGFTSKSEAVPAFARQTGASCGACHFQHFPALTAYGRTFKASGFTLGAQDLIEGRFLSLPRFLNASVIAKLRFIKTNGSSGVGSDVGEVQLPDEAAVWIGGRMGSGAGFVAEAQLADPDAPVLASFKLPLGFSSSIGRFSLVPFSSDALGAPFGFEPLNTGAVRNARVLEDRMAFSAVQYVVGDGDEGKAEGVALVFANRDFFLSVTPWTPSHGTVPLDRPAWYVRAGITPRLGGLDIGLGVQQWLGTAGAVNERTSAFATDLQVQGYAGTWPIGVYAGYARAGSSEPSREMFFNPEPRSPEGVTGPLTAAPGLWLAPPANRFNDGPRAQEAVSGLVELGVVPGRLSVAAGYREGDTGQLTLNRERAGTLGLTVLLAQNLQVQVSHVLLGGSARTTASGNRRTIVMLFAAF